MICPLPLYHCHALDCNELVAPGVFLSCKHEEMLSLKTAKKFVSAVSLGARLDAEAAALIEIAEKEGKLDTALPADASQPSTKKPKPVSGDAGIQKESHS